MTDRRSNIAKPADQSTADQSTQSASGLSGARPRPNLAPDDRDNDDLVARERRGDEEPPRRYDEDADDPALPANDATLKTKI